ncbi:MAG: citrate/2-methylcitrate synthase [Vicinamibacterales bacterium]
MASLIDAPAGLEGVVAATTRIGDVLGDDGYYHYRGHSAADLATSQPFEAIWHLLHHGALPEPAALAAFRAETGRLRAVPPRVAAVLPAITAAGTPMAMLRTALSLASQAGRSWLDQDDDERRAAALGLAAMTPALVAGAWRASRGEPLVAPDPGAGVAADYLRMITGRAPDAAAARAVERYLSLTVDHGFNASTFAARVVASTGADAGAAAVAGVAALSGPLHGGAPGRVVDMLHEIGSVDRAPAWVEAALASGRRIMGFGHRVYRTEDPRSVVLKASALEMGGPLVDLAVAVEAVVLDVLARAYPGRDLRTNVEFYAGVVLHEAGLPPALYSPTFAVSRMVGWMAHVLEQMEGNRIIRPSSRYAGPLYPRGAASA